MGTERNSEISRRKFLAWTLCLIINPDLRTPAGIEYSKLVEKSGNFEKDRVYTLLSEIPVMPTEYVLPAGRVMDISEGELVSAFKDLVTTTDTNLYSSSDGMDSSSYFVSHQVNLDPKLYGGKLHFGEDMVTTDEHKKNTIFCNPIRARLVGRVDIRRLSPGTGIFRAIDKYGQDLDVNLGEKKCGVFMLYGHLVQLKNSQQVGTNVEVKAPIGDITSDSQIGASSGPHCHVEMKLIPVERLNGEKSIQQILLEDEYGGVDKNITVDTTFIWKFLPGDLRAKIGIAPEVFEYTKSILSKRRHYGA